MVRIHELKMFYPYPVGSDLEIPYFVIQDQTTQMDFDPVFKNNPERTTFNQIQT